jgi:hypothetical protein
MYDECEAQSRYICYLISTATLYVCRYQHFIVHGQKTQSAVHPTIEWTKYSSVCIPRLLRLCARREWCPQELIRNNGKTFDESKITVEILKDDLGALFRSVGKPKKNRHCHCVVVSSTLTAPIWHSTVSSPSPANGTPVFHTAFINAKSAVVRSPRPRRLQAGPIYMMIGTVTRPHNDDELFFPLSVHLWKAL